MLTQTELEALSRQAAGKLPLEFKLKLGITDNGIVHIYSCGREIDAPFLYECTEAVTEIMVRVLWPANIVIGGSVYGHIVVWGTVPPLNIRAEEFTDPMLAYRVCILRALIAL